MSGGRNCAYGLYFQYLVSLDFLLKMAEQSEDVALHVDPDGDNDQDRKLEIVDFDIEGSGGNRSVIVQVKGSVEPLVAEAVEGPELARWLLRLVDAGQSDSYQVVTNRRLTQPAAKIATALDNGDTTSVEEAWPNALRDDWCDAAIRSRLLRCRVVREDKSTGELLGQLRSKIKDLRIRAGIGTNEASADLMTIYLHGQLFHHGAGAHPSRVSARQARDWLCIPSSEIAQSIGHYDWGLPVGIPLPQTMVRTGELADLASLLEHPRPKTRETRLVVVSGLSGSGKSALAAQFAYEHADFYDFMWWVNCESAHSLERSFKTLTSAVETLKWGVAGPSLSEIPHALSKFAGTWLIIADNVYDNELVEPWLPTFGSGDVVITTVDSTLWSNERRVELNGFTPAESRRFLMSLLPADAPRENVLDDLAAELAHWPLALAMAVAYLRNAQRDLRCTPSSYLSRLRAVAVQAQSAVPKGYPRTLAAAVSLALEQVSRRAADHPQVEGRAVGEMAITMMHAAAYFAESEIPLNMLHAAAVIDPLSHAQSGLRGPVTPCDDHGRSQADVLFDAIVTILRSGSLVQRTELMANTNIAGMFNDRITMNRIIQDVIRSRLEAGVAEYELAVFINRLIYHTDDWLRSMTDKQCFKEMALIANHAQTLEYHATRIGFASVDLSTLQGNLALSLAAYGRRSDAILLLERELKTIDALTQMVLAQGDGTPKWLIRPKTLLQLIDNLIKAERPIDEILSRVTETVEALGRFDPDDHRGELYVQWMNVDSLLRALVRHETDPRVVALRRRVRSAQRQLPTSAGDSQSERIRFAQEINELNEMLGSPGREAEVSDRARRAFESCGDHRMKIGLLGFYVEAQIYMGNTGAVTEGLREFDLFARPLNVHADEVIDRLQNVGLVAAQRLCLSVEYQHILALVVQQSEERITEISCGPELWWFHHVLSAAYHASKGNHAAARVEINAADSDEITTFHNGGSTRDWQRILAQARWHSTKTN